MDTKKKLEVFLSPHIIDNYCVPCPCPIFICIIVHSSSNLSISYTGFYIFTFMFMCIELCELMSPSVQVPMSLFLGVGCLKKVWQENLTANNHTNRFLQNDNGCFDFGIKLSKNHQHEGSYLVWESRRALSAMALLTFVPCAFWSGITCSTFLVSYWQHPWSPPIRCPPPIVTSKIICRDF